MTIRTLINKLAVELVPPFFYKTFKYLRQTLLKGNKKNDGREDISNLIETHNLSLPSESVIIGNGPSFSHFIERSKGFLNNKTVFCMNNFSQSKQFELIKPQFYVFSDPFYWDKNCSFELLELINKTYSDLRDKVRWKIIILLPSISQEWNYFINLPKENKNISIAYYNNSNNYNIENRFELYKLNKIMPQCQTVAVSALFLSLNLGFKYNYLIGVDMSLHENVFVNHDNLVCKKLKHFYDEGQIAATPFWKNAENTETYKIDELFEAFTLMYKGFREMEEYSKFLGTKIYNLSPQSYIDAFERFEF